MKCFSFYKKIPSYPNHSPETTRTVVGFGTIVIHEDLVVATVAKDGAAEIADFGRSEHPTRSFCVEISKRLKLTILLFGQDFDAHFRRHRKCVITGFVLLPCIKGPAVVTNAATPFRAFRRTIHKNVFARFFIMRNYIRLTTALLHFVERPQFFRCSF